MAYNLEALNILIVDDNPHMHQILRSILGAMHIKNVHAVTDAADAFVEMGNWQPDIIIADFKMEPLDGLEFVRMLRQGQDSLHPYVPVIMITGHTQIYRVKQARDAGVNEVLAKPVSVEGLYSRIISIIDSPRPYVKSPSYFGPDRRRRERPFVGPGKRASDTSDDGELMLTETDDESVSIGDSFENDKRSA